MYKYYYHLASAYIFVFKPPLNKPDLLAAIKPTLAPGEVFLAIQDPTPMCLWLPPPYG